MMTLRHLKIFYEAARTGNFTRAAEKLYLSQSAVSHAVGELEKEAQTPLFDRMSKAIRLTRAGELLLKEAIPILAASDSLEKKLSNLEKEAPVHIVSSITIAVYYLPKIIQTFEKIWPETEVHVRVVSAASTMEILKSGEADLALTEGIEAETPYYGTEFSACRLKAVCAPGYPAAGKCMSIAEFCKEKLLLREKGSAIREVLDSALYLTGHQVHPVWTSVNSLALISAARAGLGIAVLPDLLPEKELLEGSLAEVRIENLELTNHMTAIWHKEKYLSGPLRTFLELVGTKREEEDRVPDYISY